MKIYRHLFENISYFAKEVSIDINEEELNVIRDYTLKNLESGKLNYEDETSFLYIKNKLGYIMSTNDIKYVIIDEAQDYTPLQFEILHELFKDASMTILGDLNQSINPVMNLGGYNNLVNIFGEENSCINKLLKSYRSTKEINEFSRGILKNRVYGEYIERNGEKPLVKKCVDENEINNSIIKDIHTCNYKSLAIITKDAFQAKKVYEALKSEVNAKIIINDDESFDNGEGVIIIPTYLAKGLEFDVVIIYNANDENYRLKDYIDESLLLYAACTRALHKLHVYYTKDLTVFLKSK